MRLSSSMRPIAVALSTMLAASLILYWRKPDAFVNPQFYAEDGLVFFVDAYDRGPALGTTYSGYLHTMPRLVAWLAMASDPAWIPAIYNFATLAVELAVVLMIFSPRVPLPMRPAFALLSVLVPHTGDVFLNLTNMQWSLAIGLVLVLISEDATTLGRLVSDLLIIMLAGLTGPFLLFLTPLFCLRALTRRTGPNFMVLATVMVVSAIQAGCLIANPSMLATSGSPADPVLLASALSGRLYATFWAGYELHRLTPSTLWGGYDLRRIDPSWVWVIIGLLNTLLIVYLALRSGPSRQTRLMLLGAWIVFTAPVAAKFMRLAWAIAEPTKGDRYFFLPHVMMAWLILFAAVEFHGWKRAVAIACLGVSLALNWPSMRGSPLPDCEWGRYVQSIRDGTALSIPINPGWTIVSNGRNSRR